MERSGWIAALLLLSDELRRKEFCEAAQLSRTKRVFPPSPHALGQNIQHGVTGVCLCVCVYYVSESVCLCV
jgi:hypothetical protein